MHRHAHCTTASTLVTRDPRTIVYCNFVFKVQLGWTVKDLGATGFKDWRQKIRVGTDLSKRAQTVLTKEKPDRGHSPPDGQNGQLWERTAR